MDHDVTVDVQRISVAAKPETMSSFDHPLLPPEIWKEILARLPVKSILRCRSVCKSWYSLISCPNFISHHSITNLHNNSGNRALLHLQDSKTGAWSFSSHDMDMKSHEHDDDNDDNDDDYSPDRLIGRDFAIVGSCNGLICLSEQKYDDDDVSTVTFLIWNPAIRKIVELPSFYHRFRYEQLTCVGFGFDSSTGDYKVMCNLPNRPSWDGKIQKNFCEILDLGKGVWRSISPLLPSCYFTCRESECYVNGVVHWSVFSYTPGMGRFMFILSFNMSDESYCEMRMPESAEFTHCDEDYRLDSRCVTFGGLVHVIVWNERDDCVVETPSRCSVWTMKEYGVTESWIKVSNMSLWSAQVWLSTRLCPRNFILWANHEILMMQHPLFFDGEARYEQDLVLYDTENRKSKRLFSITKHCDVLCLYQQLRLYQESLVLM